TCTLLCACAAPCAASKPPTTIVPVIHLFIAATLKRINPEFFWNYLIDASLAWRVAASTGAAWQALLRRLLPSRQVKTSPEYGKLRDKKICLFL
ncbi:MAG: hypothetical protein RSD99_30490, partial [Janthinobacterium sp.]